MIYYLVTRPFGWTVDNYLKGYGKVLKKQFKVIPYETLFGIRRFSNGVYIFSDTERLTDLTRDLALQLWERLQNAGKGVIVLNHPVKSMARYQLLRTLHDSGVNQFNIYWLRDGVMPKRFPVFLRDETKHGYFYSTVLKTPEELSAVTKQIRSDRSRFENSIMVEFCDTSDADGIFRKYAAFMVGDRILPWYVFFSRHWDVRFKYHLKEWTESMEREEDQHVRKNPHESFIREIFHTAGIQYGRMDFGLLNGRPQVWEINTNPELFSPGQYPPQRAIRRDFFGGEMTGAFQSLIARSQSAGKSRFTVCFGIRKAAYWREIFSSTVQIVWDFLKGLFPRELRLSVKNRLRKVLGIKR